MSQKEADYEPFKLRSSLIERVRRLFKTQFDFYRVLFEAVEHSNNYTLSVPETLMTSVATTDPISMSSSSLIY